MTLQGLTWTGTKNSGTFSVDQLVKGIIIAKVSDDTFSFVKKTHADSSTAFSRYMGQVLGVFWILLQTLMI